MTTDDQPPPTVQITLGDLAEIIEGEAVDTLRTKGLTADSIAEAVDHIRAAGVIREAIALDTVRRGPGDAA